MTEDPFIAVVGNIAVGKSGFADALARETRAQAFIEDTGANPFFERFYAAPQTWAFRSQVAFVAQSLRQHVESLGQGPVVQDRTIYETVDIFSLLLHQENYLTDDELSALTTMKDAAARLPRQPTQLLYLHAPTEVIMERIGKRGRNGELNIEQAYIERLNEAYERFVSEWTISPVISIDTHEIDLRAPDALITIIKQLAA